MEKRLRIGILGYLLVAGISVACGRNISRGQQKIDGKGPQVTESGSLKALNSIRLEAPITVELVEGSDWTYTITGCRNQIDLIRIDASGGELLISTAQQNVRFRDDQPVRMTVTAPRTPRDVKVSSMGTLNISRPTDATDFSLKTSGMGKVLISELGADKLAVGATGMSKIEIGDLLTDDLVVDMSGMSNFSASGRTVRLKVDVSGMSHLGLSGLTASESECTVGGMSHAEVHADRVLRCHVSGMSHLTYSGSASDVRKVVSGMSHVHAK